MDSAKAQLTDKLKTCNNILVSVSRDPSVDQLSALLGLTLALNKMGKHAAAVFSGEVPSTLEFLQPESTFEKNTDSLRDFIIALDKSKADKLRYKVEDDVVRIFITPYKTSISDADLEFSQGDFNVDLVIALGVHRQEDLDEAITAHGRILHDATVSSINISSEGGLGSINWQDDRASSLSELVGELLKELDASLLDEQISTALLTGIVAETNRFSNEKTSAQTMSISAALMAAGANQQLVATKLEEPEPQASSDESDGNDEDDNNQSDNSSDGDDPEPDAPKSNDGTIEINHENDEPVEPAFELPSPQPDQPGEADQSDQKDESGPLDLPDVQIVEEPKEEVLPPEPTDILSPGSKLIVDPPSLGGTLTANSQPEALDPATDPLGLSSDPQPALLSRASEQPMTPPPASWEPPTAPETFAAPEVPKVEEEPIIEKSLAELEADIAAHANEPASVGLTGVDDARDEVNRALNSGNTAPAPAPIEALNAQPFGESLHSNDTSAPVGPMLDEILNPQPTDTQQTPASELPAKPEAESTANTPQVDDPNAPPPVPPPIPFNFGAPDNPQQ